MSYRLDLLKNAHTAIGSYTKTDGWRPGIVDLLVYDYLEDMSEADKRELDWVWQMSLDEAMQHIIDSNTIFTLDYGTEDLWDGVREYLSDNGITKSVDDVEEDE